MLRKLLVKSFAAKSNRYVVSIQRCTRCGLATKSGSTTVDDGEIQRFNQQSNTWWDMKGDFAALHTMNKLRVPLVKQSFAGDLSLDSSTPLEGVSILDVGCGGGILSEPIARLGATVTGLDASEEGINAAIRRRDSLQDPQLGRLSYECTSIEEFCVSREETFDMLVTSEVVEHVACLDSFIESSAKLVKPGGTIVITTINKTWSSYLFAIIAAEYILNMVPKGTHDWEKFIPPHELEKTLEKYGCKQTLLHGMSINAVTLQWSWTESTDISYAATFTKLG